MHIHNSTWKKASIKSTYNLYFLEIYMHFQKGVIIAEEAVSGILWTQCMLCPTGLGN